MFTISHPGNKTKARWGTTSVTRSAKTMDGNRRWGCDTLWPPRKAVQDQAIPLPGVRCPKGLKTHVHPTTCERIFIAAWFSIADAGNNPLAITGWACTQRWCAHTSPHAGPLLGRKKEWSTAQRCDTSEPWKHAEWKKPGHKWPQTIWLTLHEMSVSQ